MPRPLCLIIGFLSSCIYFASSEAMSQEIEHTDSIPEVRIKAYLHKQDPFRITGAISTLDSLSLNQHNNDELLSAMNSVAGVKLEERSPGSYRLSIRGSLLRSPFGVRNVKIYYDVLPLTDATGNSYLNLLDPIGIKGLSILKGPDGSLFGANSGGVVLLKSHDEGPQRSIGELELRVGSYNYFSQRGAVDLQVHPKYRFTINEAFSKKSGYRANSALKRSFLQTTQRWLYKPNAELRFIGFYADLDYQTPGGLTLEQLKTNPMQARPSTNFGPGAIEQRARIDNKTLWGGLIHEFSVSPNLRNVSAVFGSYTDFLNPFISNYEIRKESNFGFRSWLEYTLADNQSWKLTTHLGVEWQQAWHDIHNFENLQGSKGKALEADKLISNQHFYFARVSADWNKRLLLELSSSINYYSYKYLNLYPVMGQDYTPIRFNPEWMPRLALSYVIRPRLLARWSISKGYSAPTIAEIRASNRVVNTGLTAEKGWNYELGLRWITKSIGMDLAAFSFRMNNAILRTVNAQDEESFHNTGGINQSGIEVNIRAKLHNNPTQWVSQITLNHSLSLSNFTFTQYQIQNENWSGNKVAGIPRLGFNTLLSLAIQDKINLNLWHLYQAKTPLDDSNQHFADAYHLIQTKLNWNLGNNNPKINWSLWAAIDNLLNITYSLGNDLNAYGSRFYNPAPMRNFSVGAKVSLL